MKSIVVAYDRNHGIGAENDLLWQRDLPSDLRHFRELTLGKSVIMGRKTYESIGRPLPDRQNIVVSRSGFETADDVTVVSSLEEAYSAASHDIVVIGGGQLYAAAIDDMDIIYATEVDEVFPRATIFFSAIDATRWREANREHHESDERNKYAYDFVIYERKN